MRSGTQGSLNGADIDQALLVNKDILELHESRPLHYKKLSQLIIGQNHKVDQQSIKKNISRITYFGFNIHGSSPDGQVGLPFGI